MKNCFFCLKFLVAIFNCLIMILGLLILGIFLWVYIDVSPMLNVGSSVAYIIYFLIALGAIMVSMGFLGFCGALQESQCMLGTFFFMVLVVFVAQVTASSWAYTKYRFIEQNFQTTMKHTLKLYHTSESFQVYIDAMQQKVKCCGASGFQDWEMLHNKNSTLELPVNMTKAYPASCCNVTTNVTANVTTSPICNEESVYKEGCSDKIFDWIHANRNIILFIILGLSMVEILGIVFSLILCLTFRKIEEYD